MTRLRTKLEELGIKDIIQTKRGQGYILVLGDEEWVSQHFLKIKYYILHYYYL